MLILLLERLGRIIALMGLWIAPAGEPGGEAITAGTRLCRYLEGGSCAASTGRAVVRVVCEICEAEPVENIVAGEYLPRLSCEIGWRGTLSARVCGI